MNWYLGICVTIVLVGCNPALGLDSAGMDTSGFLCSNLSDNLFSQNISDATLQHLLNNYKVLQTNIRTGILKTGPVVMSSGTGWQNISLPAVISSPGNYRIINDYSASGEGIGLAITCSDVHIDGGGHTFRGTPEYECYGIGATSDARISNITVTNYNTTGCTAGIIFFGVDRGEISDTHHVNTATGITIGSSESVNLSDNTVTGISEGKSGSEIYGIAGIDVTSIHIGSNEIRNLSPSTEYITSVGIFLNNGTCLDIQGNKITGSINSGISLTDCNNSEILGNEITGPSYGISFQGEQTEISDNRILSADMAGIYMSDGQGIIRNNTIGTGTQGIVLTIDDSVISDNTIYDNLQTGLSILGTNLTLTQNILINNTYNFYMDGNRDEHYLHHIDRTNLINGKPLVYIRNGSGVSIGPADNPAMVIVASSNNIIIQNITTGANMAGIVLADVTNATISNVSDTGSMAGFGASRSKGCNLSDISVSKSMAYGFDLIEDSDVFLNRCQVSETSGFGYYLLDSKNISISSCNSTDIRRDYPLRQTYGVLIDNSSSVLIHNSIFSNSRNSGISAYKAEKLAITKSDISHNNEYGFVCARSTHISMTNSTLYDNTFSGIALASQSGYSLNRNIIYGNDGYGLSLVDVSDGLITDNHFNNTRNIELVSENTTAMWNTTLTQGRNIVNGSNLGGNFWADPDGQGFSQIHTDRGDSICDAPYLLNEKNVDYLPLAVPSKEITPDFIADQKSGLPPLTVRFTDRSTGILTQWNWTFGDGTGSHEQNPVHIYTGIGRYSVTLEGTGENGNQGVLRKGAYIDVNSGRITGPKGMLWVDSTPENGSVFIDEMYIGLTPLRASVIHAGGHQIMITSEGYQNWSGTVGIRQNQCTYVPRVMLRKKYQYI